MLMNLTNQGLI